jgi:hypothetical protein
MLTLVRPKELDRLVADLAVDGDLRAAAREIAPTRGAFLRFALAHGYAVRDDDILHTDEQLDPNWVDVEQSASCPKCATTTCNPHNQCSTSTQ